MTATDNEAMAALHALLDERQQYQEWLSTLEGRRNSTPPHVYERVQKDYTSRLDRVMQDLTERAGQLSGTIASMTEELSGLRQHESDRTDERYEAELRAAVGEYSPEDWEKKRAEADADLERIAAEKHALQDELDELQRIVALTGAMQPEPIPPELEGVDAAEGMIGAGSAAPTERQNASSESIDEFVAEWRPPQARPTPPHGSPADDRGPADTGDLSDLVIPASPMGGNPVGAAGADYGIANGVSGVKPSAAGTVAGSGADAARTQTPASAASSEARRDADKTLKCPECGAMNYATEWYCEKCGGELSTF